VLKGLSKAEVSKSVDSYLTSHNRLLIDASQLANFYVTAIDAYTIYVDFLRQRRTAFSSSWTYGSGG
jgi:hypothetical protein